MSNENSIYQVGSFNVWYKGKEIGSTNDSMKLDFAMEVQDVFVDQLPGIPVKRLVEKVKIVVNLVLFSVNDGFDLLLNSDGQITTASLRGNLLTTGGELLLVPVNANAEYQYRFPCAILEPVMSYTCDERQPQGLSVKFSAAPDDRKIYMERVAVDK